MLRPAIVGLVVLTACTGSGAAESSTADDGADAPDVTLTDEGCSGDPRPAQPPGAITIAVHNATTTGSANFELVRLAGTFDEADQFLADVRSGVEPPPGELPFIAHEPDRSFVEKGAVGELAADLGPAVYAVVCVALDENDDIITAYVVGPYTIES